jgi:hypothetical protein
MKNKYPIFLTVFFILTILASFMYPPEIQTPIIIEDYNNSEQSNKTIMQNSLKINYNTIDGFIAVYKNTIIGWAGKSKNLKGSYYLVPKDQINGSFEWFLKHYFIQLAYLLPYLIVLVILILFIPKSPKEETT